MIKLCTFVCTNLSSASIIQNNSHPAVFCHDLLLKGKITHLLAISTTTGYIENKHECTMDQELALRAHSPGGSTFLPKLTLWPTS